MSSAYESLSEDKKREAEDMLRKRTASIHSQAGAVSGGMLGAITGGLTAKALKKDTGKYSAIGAGVLGLANAIRKYPEGKKISDMQVDYIRNEAKKNKRKSSKAKKMTDKK